MATIPHPSPAQGDKTLGVTPVSAVAFLVVHVPVGLAMHAYPAASTLHALLLLALGIGWAIAGKENYVAVWSGYMVGSDVLWRMTKASIPWEFAKYALVLVLTLAILRSGRFRAPVLPFIYLGLLIPSSILVVSILGPQLAFNGISFNLSGPLALATAVWFFSRLTLTASEYSAVLIAIMAPALSIGVIAVSGVLSGELIVFTEESNLATSGGYGPNQVSSLLGLGALLSLLLFLTARGSGWLRTILFSLMIGFASQSALTFSRGGLYTAAGAVAAAAPFLVRNRGARRRLYLGGIMTVGLTVFLVLPRLQAFTGGALGTRFRELETTGRVQIAIADLMIWKENAILGVGPGMGPASRLALLRGTPAAHTEWSRLLAEHGMLGLGAAVCLIVMASRAVGRGRRPLEKALAIAFAIWACLFMLHAGMRLAAPAFAMGLAQCRIRTSSGRPRVKPT